jgi:hypothetical protein
MASITKVNLFGNLKRLNKHGIPPVSKSKRNVVVKPPLTIHGANGSFVCKKITKTVENYSTPVETQPTIEAAVENAKPIIENWKAKKKK